MGGERSGACALGAARDLALATRGLLQGCPGFLEVFF